MDIRKVKKLIELLEESQIAEIEIHEGEESVRISRQSTAAGAPVQTLVQVPGTQAAMAPVEAGAAAEGEVEEVEGHQICAPMVGLFYEAPAPGRPPFVELGREVKKGDVVCIIEAMKIMNQIEADVSGVISKIYVENGEPVEYGQPLFLIRES
jgi:acetyl-CoA carboxylase biotin carboxyl carrier protein